MAYYLVRTERETSGPRKVLKVVLLNGFPQQTSNADECDMLFVCFFAICFLWKIFKVPKQPTVSPSLSYALLFVLSNKQNDSFS